MTPERKEEVNRRLAEFDNAGPYSFVSCDVAHGPEGCDWQKIPSYTTDLNRLTRLEAKLAPHWWEINRIQQVQVTLRCKIDRVDTHSETEAEARAEAICQYLERQKDESKAAKL